MASTQSAPLLSLRAQQLFPAVTGVLLLGILSSVADVATTAFGSAAVGVEFRFRLLGLILSLAPQLGLMLAVIAGMATLAGYRVGVRWASAIALVAGVLMLIVIFPFGLDFLQSRHLVGEAQLHGFTLAGEKTAGFAGLFGLAYLWLGWQGWQSSGKADVTESRSKGQGLVVGQE